MAFALCSKNTFIDGYFTDDLIMRRTKSEPPLRARAIQESPTITKYAATLSKRAACLKSSHVRHTTTSAYYSTRKKKTEPADKLFSLGTCGTMPPRTEDTICGLTTETLEPFPDTEDEFESDISGFYSRLHGLKPMSDFANPSNELNIKSKLEKPSTDSGILEVAVTTLMLCNLPCKLSQEGLARAVDELGFAGTYDLVYVPRGFSNFIGYGFINFCDTRDANRFCGACKSLKFCTENTEKLVRVRIAKTQGLANMLLAIRKSANFRKRAHAPLMFSTFPS